MNRIGDLLAELEHARGRDRREFRICDEQGRRYELIDVDHPGGGIEVVLVIRPDDTPSR